MKRGGPVPIDSEPEPLAEAQDNAVKETLAEKVTEPEIPSYDSPEAP